MINAGHFTGIVGLPMDNFRNYIQHEVATESIEFRFQVTIVSGLPHLSRFKIP